MWTCKINVSTLNFRYLYFVEDRMRFGKAKLENFVFRLPLLSPFTTLTVVEDRIRLGKANHKTLFSVCLCSRLWLL